MPVIYPWNIFYIYILFVCLLICDIKHLLYGGSWKIATVMDECLSVFALDVISLFSFNYLFSISFHCWLNEKCNRTFVLSEVHPKGTE